MFLNKDIKYLPLLRLSYCDAPQFRVLTFGRLTSTIVDVPHR